MTFSRLSSSPLHSSTERCSRVRNQFHSEILDQMVKDEVLLDSEQDEAHFSQEGFPSTAGFRGDVVGEGSVCSESSNDIKSEKLEEHEGVSCDKEEKYWGEVPSEDGALLSADCAAALWIDEFDTRYLICKSERQAFERFRSEEAGAYLNTQRNSRRSHKLNVNYFGESMNSLCIHRLEKSYLKQGAKARWDNNERDYAMQVLKIQKKASECESGYLPPIKEKCIELGNPLVLSPYPPVLREATLSNAVEVEYNRQMGIRENASGGFTYFPML